MHRLPGYDHQTRRWELVAFLGLGFVGLWLVAGAWREAASFAVERDEIAARLSGCPVLAAGSPTNHGVTNLTAIPHRFGRHVRPS